MSTTLRERLAEALAEHEADVTSYDAGDIHGCRCGWELTAEQKRSEDYGWDDHRAHVAQALLPVVEREIAAALDAATETMLKSERWASFVKREQDFGATRALRKAAQEARERGDIGQDDGPEVWDWLEGILRRATLTADRGESA